MLRQERDYVLRLINQAAIAAARLRERLLGGAQPDEIVSATRAAEGELLGKNFTMLTMLDAASARTVLGDRQMLDAWSKLLRLEAEAHRKAGRDAEADALERKAGALS